MFTYLHTSRDLTERSLTYPYEYTVNCMLKTILGLHYAVRLRAGQGLAMTLALNGERFPWEEEWESDS